MNKFSTKSEATIFLENQKHFIENVLNITCSWGSQKDGILQSMRARNFNYSVKTETPNVIDYSYLDNFNNELKGQIVL
jgi:hypothetical protein